MKNSRINSLFIGRSRALSMLFLMLVASALQAQVSMPKVFGDHMVLQRGIDIPVWGNAKPDTRVSVEFANQKISTLANEHGKWQLRIPRMAAGGPYTMTVYQEDIQTPVIKYEDVLIGDIWLASGQSNMEREVQQSANAGVEIANARYPEIRLFNVAQDMSPTAREDIAGGNWQVCDTSSVKKASAAAYFFARRIHTELNVPIGILQTTWGGTPVEAWTSREQLLSSELTRNTVIANDSIGESHFTKDSLNLIRFWDIVYHTQNNTDQIIPKAGYDDSDWDILNMPTTFKDWNWPYYEGIVWMRKKVVIPKAMAGKDLTIHLGQPEMNYSLYFNGAEICKTIWNANPTHHYTLPSSLVKEGENTIAVRLAVLWGGGGFNPPAEKMFISDGKNQVSIAGDWKFKKDLEPAIPKMRNFHKYPSYLFNAMINPLIPFGIKGFLWYQGEDNTSDAYNYRYLFPMMINDWRIRWQQGYLSFLYVQLANFTDTREQNDWALLRESQAYTLLQPNTGMACIIDIGEAKDIHPKNKQDVGKRLALLALKQVYGKDILADGPVYQDFTVKGNKIIVNFETNGSSLSLRGDGPVTGFTIAGEDHKFVPAEAVIQGNSVVISSRQIKTPVAVRYAWADNPACNLVNEQGLPAHPFRTDNRK
jgi:sialate O-acetylesterase